MSNSTIKKIKIKANKLPNDFNIFNINRYY